MNNYNENVKFIITHKPINNQNSYKKQLRIIIILFCLLPVIGIILLRVPITYTSWEIKPTAVLRLKVWDDRTGHRHQVGEVVTTQKGRGLFIFDEDGRLMTSWAADEDAKQQIEAFKSVINSFPKKSIYDPPISPALDFPLPTIRRWSGSCDSPYDHYGELRNGPRKLLVKEKLFSDTQWYENRPTEPSAEWLRSEQLAVSLENKKLENLLFDIFGDRIEPWWLEGRDYQGSKISQKLSSTFIGYKGEIKDIQVTSQNFIIPDRVSIIKSEVRTGVQRLYWGNSLLLKRVGWRFDPNQYRKPYILFDGTGILFLPDDSMTTKAYLFIK